MSSVLPALGVGTVTTDQGLAQIVQELRRRLATVEASRTVVRIGAITGTQIADNSITTNLIVANAITANQIAANSISAGHIQAGAIQAGHIEAGAITAVAIAAGSIQAVHIQAGAITTDKLAAVSVTADKIAAGAITAGVIDAGAITTATIAAGAITADKIAAGAITSDKINVSTLSALTSNMGNLTAGTITGGTVQTSTGGARVVMDSLGLRGYGLDGVTKVFEINAGSGVASFTGVAQLDPTSVIPGGAVSVGTLPGDRIVAASISAAQLAAGSVTANAILAGSITTSKLALVNISPNMLMQAGFEDSANTGAWWATSGMTYTRVTGGTPWEGTKYGAFQTSTTLAVPSGTAATATGSGGTLQNGSYEYTITANNSLGETTPSAVQALTIPAVQVSTPAAATAALTLPGGDGFPLTHNKTYFYGVSAVGDRGETPASSTTVSVGGYPPTVTNISSGQTTAAATTLGIPVPAGANGDLLVAFVQMQVASGTSSTNDITAPSGWFLQGTGTQQGATGFGPFTKTAMFARFRNGTEGATATFTSPFAGIHNGYIAAVTNVNASIYDGTWVNSFVAGSGTTFTSAPPSITGTALSGLPFLQITVAATTNASTLTRPTGSDTLSVGQLKNGTGTAGRTLNIAITSRTANNAAPNTNVWTDVPDGGIASDGFTFLNFALRAPTNPIRASLTLPAAPTNARALRIYRSDGVTAGLVAQVATSLGGTTYVDSAVSPLSPVGWAPTLNTSEVDVSSANLSWGAVSGATSYSIYRRRTTAVTEAWGRIATTGTTSFVDTNAANSGVVAPTSNTAWAQSPISYAYQQVPVIGGQTYTASAYARGDSNAVANGRAALLVVHWLDSGGAVLSAPATADVTLTSAWQRYSLVGITAPSTAVAARVLVCMRLGMYPDTLHVDGAQLERGAELSAYTRSSADLVPGSLGGTIITPGSITSDLILAGTIQGDRIAANTIDSTRMNVGTLSAITANMGTVTAGTIQGVLYKSAASGRRVEIDSSSMRFYNSLNTLGLTVYDGYISTGSGAGTAHLEIGNYGINAYDWDGTQTYNVDGRGNVINYASGGTWNYTSWYDVATAQYTGYLEHERGRSSNIGGTDVGENITRLRTSASTGNAAARAELVAHASGGYGTTYTQLAVEYTQTLGNYVYLRNNGYYANLMTHQGNSTFVMAGGRNKFTQRYGLYNQLGSGGWSIGTNASANVTWDFGAGNVGFGDNPSNYIIDHYFNQTGGASADWCGVSFYGMSGSTTSVTVANKGAGTAVFSLFVQVQGTNWV